MADRFSPQDLAHYQAMADADPAVQKARQQYQGAKGAWPAPRPSWLPPGLMIEARSGRVTQGSTLGDEFTNPAWLGTMAGLGTLGVTSAMGVGPFASSAASSGANAATNMVVPEGTVDDIPSVFGPGVTERASDYGFPSGGSGGGRNPVGDVASNLAEGATKSTTDRLLEAAFKALAGVPGLMSNNGPSDEERAYQAQASRLLGQQEQRTQFQSPLYEAATKMAFGLLPTMGNKGQAYPINSLSDVPIPSVDDLLKRRA